MKKHEIKCPVVKQFQKYIDLVKENEFLKTEVKRLSSIKGRKPVKIWNVQIREYAKEFPKNQLLVAAWKRLYQGNLKNGVPALLKIFLATVPRFYKIAPCFKLVEVCGHFEEIRTGGEIHVVEIAGLAQALYYCMISIIEDNLELFNLARNDFVLKQLRAEFYAHIGDNKSAVAFVRNALIDEVRRRRDGKPVKMNSVEIHLTSVKNKKTRKERPGGTLTL